MKLYLQLDEAEIEGLCTYIKDTLNFLELKDLSDPVFETQQFLLKPKRHPRGINSIILATVYHPPQNNDLELGKHLFQSLDSAALAKFPNAGIVMLGDFNKFNPSLTPNLIRPSTLTLLVVVREFVRIFNRIFCIKTNPP